MVWGAGLTQPKTWYISSLIFQHSEDNPRQVCYIKTMISPPVESNQHHTSYFRQPPDSLLNNWQVSKSPNRIKPTKQVYKSCEKNYKAGDFLNTLVGWVTTQQYQKSIEINTKDGKVPCRCKTHHWLWEWIRSRGWKNREQAVNNKTQENSVGAAQVGGSCELDYGIVEIKQLSGVLVGWRKCLNQM